MERQIIIDKTFDEERALYGTSHITAKGCCFDGPADGESAFKESHDIIAENCYFNLRYPFWHTRGLVIDGGEMTSLCRAAVWYCVAVEAKNVKMHGIKAFRECSNVEIDSCDIISPEFGWNIRTCKVANTTAESEYFFMNSRNLTFENVKLKGKYSFQYIENAIFDNCDFDTKDAFWHGKNITVRNSVIKGEYFAWYSDNLTLENCTVIGTQPFCYCTDLKLVNCTLIDADLAFEKSYVQAEIISPVISIKNPRAGVIAVPKVEELIFDDPDAKGEVVIVGKPS